MSCAAGCSNYVDFLVNRYGARPFLVGGALLMSLSISAMSFSAAYWQVLLLCLLSGIGNSVIYPTDYAILTGSVRAQPHGPILCGASIQRQSGIGVSRPGDRGSAVMLGWRSTLLS